MTILCGTDFSVSSTTALYLASDLAQRFSDSLLLVHAIAPVHAPVGAGEQMRAIELSTRRAAADWLEQEAATLRAEGVSVEVRLVDGFADRTLVSLGHESGARLIVVGRHGRRGGNRWFGSTADRVLDSADRPVLVVPPEAARIGHWARGERPLAVQMGLDTSRASEAALEGVRLLRRAGPCDVCFVHLYSPAREYARFGLDGARNLLVGDGELYALLERDLRARIGDLPGQGRVALHLRPTSGDLGESLGKQVEQAVDLVVVGTHQRRGWDRVVHGSVAHAVVREATTPVLCVPTSAPAEEPALARPRLAHVLCAIDFSPVGGAVLAYAYALARDGGVVELCHIHEDGALTPSHRAELERRLEALAPANIAGVISRATVIEGEGAGDAIARAADRLGVDLICVGSRGRSNLAGMVLGSVSQDIMRRTTRPVLVVRQPTE